MKFELTQNLEGSVRKTLQWRWRLVATNGKIVAIGGESFNNLSDMVSTLRNIFCTSLKRSIELEKAILSARAKAVK